MPKTNTVWYDSPLGLLRLEATPTALRSLFFAQASSPPRSEPQKPTPPKEHLAPQEDKMPEKPTPRPLTDPLLEEVCNQLDHYFTHRRHNFELPLEPQGTPFQQRVWQLLQQIPFGQTCSYLELSQTLGCPQAVRAVGSANGSNPLSIVIPCHRVISSKGELTGYDGGLWRKEWLLRHEGALLL